MGISSLAPGFRFSPTDVELLKYYLKRKLMGKRLHFKVIGEVDIYKYDPWDLPDKSCWESGDLKWFFFCPREKKYPNGNRVQRATESGYWKVTGKDRSVLCSGEVVGWIKTLIFHSGRAPQGDRTDWVMHEYRLEDQGLTDRGVSLDSYVLCIIFQKEGVGPRIGAQYGAPFKEEDWSDDEVEICFEAVQNANMPGRDLGLPCNYNNLIATNSPEDIDIGPSSGSCKSDILPSSYRVLEMVSSNYVTVEKPHPSNGDDILSMFDCSTVENTFFMSETSNSKVEVCLEAVPNASMPESDLLLSNNCSISTSTCFPEGLGRSQSESCISGIVPPPCYFFPPETGNHVTTEKPHFYDGDDILAMLDCFTEENTPYIYENDKNEVGGCGEAGMIANMPEPDIMLPSNFNSSISTDTWFPKVIDIDPSLESCRIVVLPPCKVVQPVPCNYVTMEKPYASNGDDITLMMDSFAEESTILTNESDKNEELYNPIPSGNTDASPHFNASNVYEDLGDWGGATLVEAGICSGGLSSDANLWYDQESLDPKIGESDAV